MGLDRRAFLKFFAGASAGIMATPLPWKLLDDLSIWTQNWPWIPRLQSGANAFTRTVSKTCPSSTAFTLRHVGNRPVRILPDPSHPLGGGVTPLAAAEVQMLFSPSRITRPLVRSKDGALVETTWENAAKMLSEALEKAGDKTAFISGDETGSTTEVISAFAAKFGSQKVFLMPSEAQVAARACALMGIKGQLGYDVANSDYILAIGANIMESFGPVVATRKAFFAKRPHSAEAGNFLAYAGPVRNNTGAVADAWLALTPGTEGVLAIGIAAELIRRGKTFTVNEYGEFKALCDGYTPEKVAQITGVDAAKVAAIVDGLLAAKAPLVITGGNGLGGQGAAPVIAGFAVNALLGSINKPGGVQILPLTAPVMEGASPQAEILARDLVDWVSFKASGTELLVVHEANPYFALPDTATVKKALDAIPFKVAFASLRNETVEHCNLVLPIAMGLERLDDTLTPYGFAQTIYCTSSPAVTPGDMVRDTPNLLLFIASQMGKDLGFDRYMDVLVARAEAMGTHLDVIMRTGPVLNSTTVSAGAFSVKPALLAKALPSEPATGLALAVEVKSAVGTATTGIPPFNTKVIRASELAGHKLGVVINPKTAESLGVHTGSNVKVASGWASVQAVVTVSEKVAPGAVSAIFGLGRTAFDAYSQNKGANVMSLQKAVQEPESGLAVWSQAAVTVTKA